MPPKKSKKTREQKEPGSFNSDEARRFKDWWYDTKDEYDPGRANWKKRGNEASAKFVKWTKDLVGHDDSRWSNPSKLQDITPSQQLRHLLYPKGVHFKGQPDEHSTNSIFVETGGIPWPINSDLGLKWAADAATDDIKRGRPAQTRALEDESIRGYISAFL